VSTNCYRCGTHMNCEACHPSDPSVLDAEITRLRAEVERLTRLGMAETSDRLDAQRRAEEAEEIIDRAREFVDERGLSRGLGGHYGLREVIEQQVSRALSAEARVAELEGALRKLLPYTEACEGLLNCSPAGQVLAARALLTPPAPADHLTDTGKMVAEPAVCPEASSDDPPGVCLCDGPGCQADPPAESAHTCQLHRATGGRSDCGLSPCEDARVHADRGPPRPVKVTPAAPAKCGNRDCLDGYVPSQPDGEPEPCPDCKGGAK